MLKKEAATADRSGVFMRALAAEMERRDLRLAATRLKYVNCE